MCRRRKPKRNVKSIDSTESPEINKSKATVQQPMENIRAGARTALSAERRHQRTTELGRRRLLDQTSNEVATVEEIASKLKTASAVSVADLVLLKNGLLSENSIQLFLKTHGALRGLIREFTGADTAKQCVAAECLCNLALSDARSCLVLAKAAGAYLLLYLRSLNTDLAVTCAWTLGNMAGSDARVCRALAAQGATATLAGLLAGARGDLRDAACYALAHFVYALKNELSSDELSTLTRALAEIKRDAAEYRLLFLLSCHPRFLETDAINNEFVSSLLSDLSLTSSEVLSRKKNGESGDKQTHIVRVLANICAMPVCSDFVLSCWRDPKYFSELDVLLSTRTEHFRSNVLWLLGNIFNNCTKSCEHLLLFNSISDKIL